jgi:hypothetical protein
VSFLQNNAKMVDLLASLPSELDVVLLEKRLDKFESKVKRKIEGFDNKISQKFDTFQTHMTFVVRGRCQDLQRGSTI